MVSNEAYMLGRDGQETARLNFQHNFIKEFGHGEIIHPSIPQKSVRSVADVGTGTAVWLREVAEQLEPADGLDRPTFVGFDYSPDQFPRGGIPNIDLVVHDATKRFPEQYHNQFDLVHVRLLSYAIKAEDVQNLVDSILEIVKPGGYLQWQEFDAIDTWCTPETPMGRILHQHVVSERIARGLTAGFVTPLVNAINANTLPLAKDEFNPLTFRASGARIHNLQTITTEGHPSAFIQTHKRDRLIIPTCIAMLQLSIARRLGRLNNSDAVEAADEEQKAALAAQVETAKEVLLAIQRGEDPATCEWDTKMTWIVARKAFAVKEGGDWMETTHNREVVD